jgi:hypothetical protein
VLARPLGTLSHGVKLTVVIENLLYDIIFYGLNLYCISGWNI